MRRFGLPFAFQRMPPASQMLTLCPHGQQSIQCLDSLSMSAAQALGSTEVMNFCNDVIATSRP